ncbi:MAG: homoserine dehydrogenase [Ruminococcaceae bacterium]|nr:homoserine dehydrogenase [Oscillospiraceae bacterium]
MIKIAVMGFGTVGSGVVEVLAGNAEHIARNAGSGIEVKYILDTRDFPDSPYQHMLTHDFSDIENDAEVQVVVEAMGGVGAAYEFTRRCLAAGKSVVTSNKELVATRGQELLSIAQSKNVNYLFEASVGGGIPIIRPITQCLAANEITQIYGILNGTTNYILTQMIRNGSSFEDALRSAQSKGYAELNPAADIEGHDACRKICILSDLCFGKNVDPACVSTEGITGIHSEDVVLAGKGGYVIKLLGRALRREDGRIHAYVAPHLLSESSLLAGVDGVMNGIVVNGNALGEAMFYGAGAGKFPTASAVVADVIDAAKHLNARKPLGWDEAEEDYVAPTEELVSRWYIRAQATEAELKALYGDVTVLEGAAEGECAVITAPISGKLQQEKAEKLTVFAAMRIMD